MKKILTYIGGGIVFCLAAYGAGTLLFDRLDASHGKKAVETAHPFVSAVGSAAGEKLKEAIQQTPDEKLEKGAEDLSRKIYPLAKGAIKGQLDAILKDTGRTEVPKQMYQAGKDVTEKVVRPFAEGLADGSARTLDSLDKTIQGVRKFKEDNKDLIDALASGLESVKKGIEQHPRSGGPPPPPWFLPPPPPLPFQDMRNRAYEVPPYQQDSPAQ